MVSVKIRLNNSFNFEKTEVYYLYALKPLHEFKTAYAKASIQLLHKKSFSPQMFIESIANFGRENFALPLLWHNDRFLARKYEATKFASKRESLAHAAKEYGSEAGFTYLTPKKDGKGVIPVLYPRILNDKVETNDDDLIVVHENGSIKTFKFFNIHSLVASCDYLLRVTFEPKRSKLLMTIESITTSEVSEDAAPWDFSKRRAFNKEHKASIDEELQRVAESFEREKRERELAEKLRRAAEEDARRARYKKEKLEAEKAEHLKSLNEKRKLEAEKVHKLHEEDKRKMREALIDLNHGVESDVITLSSESLKDFFKDHVGETGVTILFHNGVSRVFRLSDLSAKEIEGTND